MNPRHLRVEQALDLLPGLEDLIPLRDALLEASRPDEERAWAASEAYATVDSRLADPDRLEAELPAVLARAQQRLETVYRETLEALRAAKRGDPAGAARALVAAGEAEEMAGRGEAAARFYERAAEVARRPRDRRPEGLALRRLARLARGRGELERAAELYRRGLEIAEAQRDREGMVVACQGLGNVCVDQGRWVEAERWYRRGLELLADEPPSPALWQLQSNLSAVTRRVGRLEQSEQWLQLARATVEQLGDAAGQVYVLNAAGLLDAARGEHARAEAAYREALRQAAAPAERARVLVNLAEVLLIQGRAADSERVLRELEQVALTHRLVLSLPYAYRGLGSVARLRRDEDGFVFYEQALELCRERHLPEMELALTQEEYAAFEAAFGRAEAAMARLAEAREIFQRLAAGAELERVLTTLTTLAEAREGAGGQGNGEGI